MSSPMSYLRVYLHYEALSIESTSSLERHFQTKLHTVSTPKRQGKSNGKYKYYWLYRVKFGIPATNLATKGDSITFSTPTIEGTVLTRNKADASGKHPWKAEVTEGDTGVANETITNWYKQVYEPVITTTEEG